MQSQIKSIARAAAVAVVIASTALAGSARAGCWSPQEVQSAHVRELDTMLMVASLRCRIAGRDFTEDYNGFVRENRPMLTRANDSLRDHFFSSGGLNAFDRYVTRIANRYGGGADSMNCKDFQTVLEDARDARGSLPKLLRLASNAGIQPNLPGGLCTTTIASAR